LPLLGGKLAENQLSPSSQKANKGIAVKSVLPTTKFKLQAQARPPERRLAAPRKGPSSPLHSGSSTLKGPRSASSAARLLGRLDQLSEPRSRLYSSPISTPPHYRWPEIPRYVFVGDQPGESEIRLGIFAGLRGEDNAGARAIAEFIDDLVSIPSLGSAFRIYAYPTANPLSYTAGAPRKETDRPGAHPSGRKLKLSEVELIEREIFVVQFHGIVIIHTTDEPEGLQAAVYGANLHETLVSPILSSLEPLFPTAELPDLDSSFSLTADAALKQKPFELALGIPRSGWRGLYSMGLRIALHTAVEQYRSYLAQANNI
jgi:murein peptide amidase A